MDGVASVLLMLAAAVGVVVSLWFYSSSQVSLRRHRMHMLLVVLGILAYVVVIPMDSDWLKGMTVYMGIYAGMFLLFESVWRADVAVNNWLSRRRGNAQRT